MRGRALGAGVPPHPRRVRSPKTTITSAKRTTPGAGKARRWVTVAVTARTCCPKQLESTQNPKQPRRSVEHPLSGHFNSPPHPPHPGRWGGKRRPRVFSSGREGSKRPPCMHGSALPRRRARGRAEAGRQGAGPRSRPRPGRAFTWRTVPAPRPGPGLRGRGEGTCRPRRCRGPDCPLRRPGRRRGARTGRTAAHQAPATGTWLGAAHRAAPQRRDRKSVV